MEVSADGGASWAEAEIGSHLSTKALTRFRIPWLWNGQPAMLMSRATDDRGALQPSRQALLAERGRLANYHYNGIQCWSVSTAGEVRNAYA